MVSQLAVLFGIDFAIFGGSRLAKSATTEVSKEFNTWTCSLAPGETGCLEERHQRWFSSEVPDGELHGACTYDGSALVRHTVIASH